MWRKGRDRRKLKIIEVLEKIKFRWKYSKLTESLQERLEVFMIDWNFLKINWNPSKPKIPTEKI
jgi:hypothetical protein